MDKKNLKLDCTGTPRVDIWLTCHSVSDIEYVIDWLQFAKDILSKLEKRSSEQGSNDG